LPPQEESLIFSCSRGVGVTEHAPRPPVPGEEGGDHPSFRSSESPSSATPTPRRPDLDLGYEPEGSASPTPPYLKWAESLHSLLDDQEGIQLFRGFLRQEGCGDQLDFWFACSGFRKSSQEKRPKLAKAIYRKYIQDSNGIVSRQIKPATKSFIRDCVVRLHLDPAMFQQAQTEIQSTMEENTYPLFLKSDPYLEYTQTGEESPKPPSDHSSSSGTGPGPLGPGYLPTLTEDVEWRCVCLCEEESGDMQASRLTQRLLMETAPHRVSTNRRAGESREYRPCRELVVNPYYVNMGSARAPVTSANDSEQQSMSSVSDGDTLSLTDSSVDGVPPYRYRKQHRREMHESAKANGRVPLPHIPRTYRVPKDVHVEPERFAVDLISRLEGVLREREAQERLEERLKRVRLEEEGDDADVSMVNSLPPYGNKPLPPHYGSRYSETSYNGVLALQDAHEENPESILDEHVQRVMKTPGCQSPGTGRHSPKSRSPDGVYPPPHSGRTQGPPGVKGHKPGAKGGDPAGMGAGVYHHKHGYHHPPGGTKPKEPQMDEVVLGGGSRTQGSGLWNGEAHHYATGKGRNYADGAGTMDAMGYRLVPRGGYVLSGAEPTGKGDEGRVQEAQVPLEDLERNHKILQWMMEGEALRHKKNTHGSTTGSRKTQGSVELLRPSSVERPGAVHPWVSAQLRNNVQPSHPFIQDPTMPPNPAPNPLTQLEEARRRLEEERRRAALLQAKQRQKSLSSTVCLHLSSRQKSLSSKKQVSQCENVTVAYYFCGEPIPYRTTVKGRVVTLGQFKELLTKKGYYRFYFKKVSDEFDCGVVFEEVKEDDAVLPIYEEKIIGKVEKVD
uniref:Axin-1 n=1 Tax=Salmo trutta TaxID=8032 RepID=A0A674A2S5_SALTR